MQAMAKKVAIIGASIGGLVAAAELKLKGFNVTLIERGKSVGGLYGNVDTPFGKQEMGMHVLYLTEPHHDHLCSIFGEDVFHGVIRKATLQSVFEGIDRLPVKWFDNIAIARIVSSGSFNKASPS